MAKLDNFSIILFFFYFIKLIYRSREQIYFKQISSFFFNVCELVIHSLSATSCPFSIVFFSFHFHGMYSRISNSTFQQRTLTHLRIKLLKVTLKRKFIFQVFHYSITFYNISLSKE